MCRRRCAWKRERVERIHKSALKMHYVTFPHSNVNKTTSPLFCIFSCAPDLSKIYPTMFVQGKGAFHSVACYCKF